MMMGLESVFFHEPEVRGTSYHDGGECSKFMV
jgi:hypothetical protein